MYTIGLSANMAAIYKLLVQHALTVCCSIVCNTCKLNNCVLVNCNNCMLKCKCNPVDITLILTITQYMQICTNTIQVQLRPQVFFRLEDLEEATTDNTLHKTHITNARHTLINQHAQTTNLHTQATMQVLLEDGQGLALHAQPHITMHQHKQH